MFSKLTARKYCALAFLIILLLIENAENRMTLTLTGINCTILDPRFATITLCVLKPVQRNIKEASVRAVLKQPFDNATLNVAIKRRGYNHLKPTFEQTVDVCAFLRSKHRNIIANIGYRLMGFARYSNLNRSCPIHHALFLDKARIDENLLGLLPFPPGDYTAFTRWTMYQVPCVQIDIRFKFVDV